MVGEDRFPSGVAKMYCHTFRSKREHMSTSERMTSEPHLGSLAQFELDRAGAQSDASRKTGVSDFPN
jgi:hypothetical protein